MLRSREGKKCKTCDCTVPPDQETRHQNSVHHNLNIMKHWMITREEELLKNKQGIRLVSPDTNESGQVFTVDGIVTEFKDVRIEIFSDHYDVTLRIASVIVEGNIVKIDSPVEDSKVVIKKGSSHTLELKALSDQQYSRTIPIGFVFSRQGENHIYIMRYLRVTFRDPTIRSLEPESPYVAVEPVAQLPPAVRIVKMKMSQTSAFKRVAEARIARSADNFVPGADEEAEEMFVNTEAVRKIALPMYYPPRILTDIHMFKLEEPPDMTEDFKEYLDEVRNCLDVGIKREKPENYGKFFTTLLAFEDIQQETDIRMYDKEKAALKYFEDDLERFEVEVEGLEEGRPSLLRFDKIYIRSRQEPIEYEGFVDKIKARSVEIIMGPEFVKLFYDIALPPNVDEDEVEDSLNLSRKSEDIFGIRFTVSRKTMRLMYRALNQYTEAMERSPLDELLMPRVQWPAEPTITDCEIKLVNKHIGSNPEQLCAVRNIVLGLHRPLAYVLFGPPGTGKTTTITEAIVQVYRLLPESRILIVAPSNSAVNVVTEKILNSNAVPRSDIFRLCGVNSPQHRVSPELRSVTNWRDSSQQFEEVGMDIIMGYRIVACTLSMSGVIVTMGVPKGFFTHIFIDEAGHAMEPEALIPIAGLLEPYDVKAVGGSVILSGDHLQLGPIIRSPIAKAFGMVKSLLERIMETVPYSRKQNNAYNPMVLTKLLRNFRSHPSILDVPNDLFYDGELEAVGDKDITHSMVSYDKLPMRGTPLIFHGVYGRELRESNNPSFFNPEEISVVVGYVRHLLSENTKTFDDEPIKQSDIGIIAPYRKQVLKLRFFLKQHGFPDITVGSTEEFQGQERLIMIITTVRCSQKVFDVNPGQSLGFLKNRKRFNVAVTRAKALMIIVGDPKILVKDYCWKKLLISCKDQNCCVGEMPIPDSKQYGDLFEKLKSLELTLTGDLQAQKLSSKGQVAITQTALQEEPQWKEDE